MSTPAPYSEPVSVKCPLCQNEAPPVIKEKISTGGWILFVALLLVCLPLCWLPFVLKGCKEQERRCARCGGRLG